MKKVDTIYQQTEWDNASTDVMLLRKFEELNVSPKVRSGENWSQRIGGGFSANTRAPSYMHDSDYVEKSFGRREVELKNTRPVPNTMAMSEKRFERYLRRVRRLGPEFEVYLEEAEAQRRTTGMMDQQNSSTGSYSKSLYSKANDGTKDYTRFLADKLAQQYEGNNASALRPFPHPCAGLSYIQSNSLQTALTSDPVPGRALHKQETRTKRLVQQVNEVAVAGWVGTVPYGSASDAPAVMDWGSDDSPRSNVQSGRGKYRPHEFELINPPAVVGKSPQRMAALTLDMRLVDWADEGKIRLNPYKPGTAEGIAHQERSYKQARSLSGESRLEIGRLGGRESAKKNAGTKSKGKAEASILLQSLRNVMPNKGVRDEDL